MKELAIILLNYNNVEDTLECVESIEKNCESDYTIIVVDNNSTKDSKDILIKNKKRYKLILNPVNEGFAQGNNVGIKWAIDNNFKYIMLLNNDTLIERGSIELLLNEMNSNPNIGIIGPRIMYYPEKNKIWFDGGEIDWFKFIVNHNNIGKKISTQNSDKIKENVSFLTGCCMLINRNLIEQIGYLPEEYFMYYEDVDYCVMVKDAGYDLINLKESIIYHKVSSSSGGEDSTFSIKWGTRNRIIFMNKYKYKVDKTRYIASVLFFYSTRIIKLIKYILKKDKERYSAIIDGIKEGKKYIEGVRYD